MESLFLKSYSKVNVGLQIMDKRPDSFHNINTIFQELDFYDCIELEKKDFGCSFFSNVGWLKNDNSNLCIKAWKQFSHKYNVGGVSIKLDKQIPSGSGLGGGSSNAATILKGLCELYKVEPNYEELVSISINLGADVSFFINGGLQKAKGIGDNLTSLPGCIDGVYLLVIPKIKINTEWAYKNCKKILDNTKEELNFASFLKKDEIPFEFFENDFESIVVPAYPEIAEIKEKLSGFGPKFVSLSGSGSTVYGIFDDEAKAKIAESLFSSTYTTFITRPVKSKL
ncbi:MAG: 4-(cytidine 5'-diphospho)-2-C-methyl-D-erythritol kinase [Candidatus Neomarinimicrobiota bacterium]